MGGDDACVNVISKCGVVGVLLERIVGEGDETCVGEGGVSVNVRGIDVWGESFGLCVD